MEWAGRVTTECQDPGTHTKIGMVVMTGAVESGGPGTSEHGHRERAPDSLLHMHRPVLRTPEVGPAHGLGKHC